MYPVFLQDWLRVWPREQLFIMRYEDYGGHERERIAEVLDFLGLGNYPSHQTISVISSRYSLEQFPSNC